MLGLAQLNRVKMVQLTRICELFRAINDARVKGSTTRVDLREYCKIIYQGNFEYGGVVEKVIYVSEENKCDEQ